MIRNTDSECKVLSTRVTKSKAVIRMLIHSRVPQEIRDKDNPMEIVRPNRVFQFFFREGQTMHKISNTKYWIDRNNNYDMDSLNIDINQHKEFNIELDISRSGNANMKGRRWVRKGMIVLRDITESPSDAWFSQEIEFVSDEVEVPDIKDIQVFSQDEFNKLHVRVQYLYKTHQNFSFTNQNLYTAISIRSNETQQILENAILYEQEMSKGWVGYTFNTKYDTFIVIDVELKNLRGETLVKVSKLYKPFIKNFIFYTKYQGKVRRVERIYVK